MSPFGFTPAQNPDDAQDPKNSDSSQSSQGGANSDASGNLGDNGLDGNGNPDFAALFSFLQSQMQSQFGEALPPELSSDIQAQWE